MSSPNTLADDLHAIRAGISPEEALAERKLSYQEQIKEQWRLLGLYEHQRRTPEVESALSEDPLDSITIARELQASKRRINLAFNDLKAGLGLDAGMYIDGRFVGLPDDVVDGLQNAITYGWWNPANG